MFCSLNAKFLLTLDNLQHIIHQYDVGTYEYEGYTIVINKKNNIVKNKIKCTNPKLKDSDKYLIY